MDLSSQRTINEIIIKTLALYIAITFAYGHLHSLQGRAAKVSTRYRILLFGALPVLPITDLLINATKLVFRLRGDTPWYFVLLDINRAVSEQDNGRWPGDRGSDARDNTARNPARNHPRNAHARSPTCVKIGRFCVIVALLSQSVTATLLSFRRRYFGKNVHPLENKNILVSISGILICLQSAPLLFFNSPMTVPKSNKEKALRWIAPGLLLPILLTALYHGRGEDGYLYCNFQAPARVLTRYAVIFVVPVTFAHICRLLYGIRPLFSPPRLLDTLSEMLPQACGVISPLITELILLTLGPLVLVISLAYIEVFFINPSIPEIIFRLRWSISAWEPTDDSWMWKDPISEKLYVF